MAEPLQSLVEAEILLPRRYGAEIQYEFRHVLLQRMAYESMLQMERRATHQGVVTVLRGADKSGQAPFEVIAYHLTEADGCGQDFMRLSDPRISKPSNTSEPVSRSWIRFQIRLCAGN